MRRTASLLAACLWPVLACAAEPEPAGPPAAAPATAATAATPTGEAMPRTLEQSQQDAYQKAVDLMAENRYDEAKIVLERLLKEAPQYAGAWLELAITHCELGNAAEAEQMFREVEQRFNPGPGILEVINARRQRGCLGWVPKTTRSLTVMRAGDSNVNQGASNPIFVTGGTEVHLADDFLPQRDSYTQASLDLTRELTQQGTVGVMQLRGRKHDHLNEQDTVAMLVGLERPFELGNWAFRTVGSVGMVALGGQLYQRQVQLQGWVAPPLTLPKHFYLLGTAALGHIEYTHRHTFNANSAEAGLVASYRGDTTQGQAGTGFLVDHGHVERLGGNRHGWYANAQLQHRFSQAWQGEFGWSRQDWQGQTLYSPGSIDTVRLQSTQQWRVALAWQAAPQHSLLVEWRHVRNKENISLYQYSGHALQLSWRWNGF